jgi:hypothetical protein
MAQVSGGNAVPRHSILNQRLKFDMKDIPKEVGNDMVAYATKNSYDAIK